MLVIKREWMEIRFYDDCSIYQEYFLHFREFVFLHLIFPHDVEPPQLNRHCTKHRDCDEVTRRRRRRDEDRYQHSSTIMDDFHFAIDSVSSFYFFFFWHEKVFIFISSSLFVLVNESKEIIMCNNDLAQGSKVFGGWKKKCRLNGFIVIRLDCMSSLFHSLLYFFADPLRRLSDDVWCVLLLFFAAPSHHDVLVRASWANQCAHNGWVYCATEIFVGFSGLAREKREFRGFSLEKSQQTHKKRRRYWVRRFFFSVLCVFSAVVPLRQ